MDKVTIPTLFPVQQSLPKGDSLDIDRTLAADWERLNLGEQVAGKRIALGFGSRGVSSIDIIAKIVGGFGQSVRWRFCMGDALSASIFRRNMLTSHEGVWKNPAWRFVSTGYLPRSIEKLRELYT